jgi:biopolymer transport protein ExbD
MAAKQRFLDVWIVDTNTVYKEVPFTVVSDWLQQGRLLENDRVRPSGTREWIPLSDFGEMRPFVPRQEPHRPDDQAEALEHVGLDFAYKRPGDEEDDDVDMIPLIDVSLVLLVFFMLTATAATMASYIQTPATDHGLMADNPDSMRIDIGRDEEGLPVYALGVGSGPPGPEVATQSAILIQLRDQLANNRRPVEVVINAHKDLPAKVARDLLLALRAEPFRSKVSANYFGVSEKEQ